MFLRSHQRRKDGKEHAYWSLVETTRTADGPRQRTLCYLGELNSSAHAQWLKTVEVFNEQGPCSGDDIALGDNGEVLLIGGLVTEVRTTDTQDASGGSDTMSGSTGEDILVSDTAVQNAGAVTVNKMKADSAPTTSTTRLVTRITV